jgi:hypothetical protein
MNNKRKRKNKQTNKKTTLLKGNKNFEIAEKRDLIRHV